MYKHVSYLVSRTSLCHSSQSVVHIYPTDRTLNFSTIFSELPGMQTSHSSAWQPLILCQHISATPSRFHVYVRSLVWRMCRYCVCLCSFQARATSTVSILRLLRNGVEYFVLSGLGKASKLSTSVRLSRARRAVLRSLKSATCKMASAWRYHDS